jgi:hypothetical protein
MSTVNNGPQIVRTGLVLDLDASHIRSYSPNVMPNPTDIFAWCGSAGANAATLSRDTSMTRQYGSIPMKMAVTGNDPYTNTINYGPGASSTWNLAPAANGQTWTISVYVKASVATTGELFLMPADSNGVAITAASGAVSITTSWTRVSFTYTITSATTAFIQGRLDGTPTGGSGINIWWDGMQVERASSATRFNPYYFGNTIWRDTSGNGYNGSLISSPIFSNTNGGNFSFNGTSQYVDCGNVLASLTNLSLECFVKFGTQSSLYGGVISKTLSNANGWEIRVGASTSTTTDLQFRYVGDNAAIGFNSSFNNGTWYHIVVTGTSGSQKAYVNGIQNGSGTTALSPSANSNSLLIGQLAYGSQKVNMTMACARIYNKVLSPEEVMRNYQATKTRFGL